MLRSPFPSPLSLYAHDPASFVLSPRFPCTLSLAVSSGRKQAMSQSSGGGDYDFGLFFLDFFFLPSISSSYESEFSSSFLFFPLPSAPLSVNAGALDLPATFIFAYARVALEASFLPFFPVCNSPPTTAPPSPLKLCFSFFVVDANRRHLSLFLLTPSLISPG